MGSATVRVGDGPLRAVLVAKDSQGHPVTITPPPEWSLTGPGCDMAVDTNGMGATVSNFTQSVSVNVIARGAMENGQDAHGSGSITVLPALGAAISSFTITETSGLAQAPSFIPQIVGLPFKKGDIPAGTWPQFKMRNGGQFVPFSMPAGLKTTWSDGSLKRATFLFRIPVAMAASSSQPIDIYAGGSDPGPSARSLADLSTVDLTVNVTGLDNLSGDWFASLKNAVAGLHQSATANRIEDQGGGPVGHFWKVTADFEQAGAPHSHLTAAFYVCALSNVDGSLYGIRAMAFVEQPWFNDTRGAKIWRSFSALTLRNGATILRDMVASMPAPATATFSSASPYYTKNGHGWSDCLAMRITGTLPSNVTAGKTYFSGVQDANRLFIATNSIRTQTLGAPTNAGSCTFTCFPYIVWGGHISMAGPNATWDFIGGGSRAAITPTLQDHTTRIVFDKAYWRQSKLMPAWDPAMVTNAYPRLDYRIGVVPSWLDLDQGSTGEGPERSLLHGACISHWVNQDANTEQAVRLMGILGGCNCFHIRDFATNQEPIGNNNTYAGMPAANKNFAWGLDQPHTIGFTVPTDPNVLQQQFRMDLGHMTDQSYYQFLMTGEPQYLDHLKAYANSGALLGTAMSGDAVPPTINDTTFAFSSVGPARMLLLGGKKYYGLCNFIGGAGRVSAWAMRLVAGAAALVPDADKAKPYHLDLNADNWAATKAMVAMMPQWGQDRGAWPTTFNTSGLWTGYEMQSAAFASCVTESADALAQAAYLAKWPAWITNTFGAYHVSNYGAYIKKNATGGLMSDDTLWGIQVANVAWSHITNRLTVKSLGAQHYTVGNGQRIGWFSGDTSVKPGGTAFFTPYTQVNCNQADQSFEIQDAQGNLVVITDDNAGGVLTEGLFNAAAGVGASANGPETYNQNNLGGLRYCKYAGAVVDQHTIDALQAIATANNYDFKTQPQFNFSDAA